MFLTHRPTTAEVERFLTQARDLPLSYEPVGIARDIPTGFRLDVAEAVVGKGEADFARAQDALRHWRQFELGWVELFPPNAPAEPGTFVAVLVHHGVLWSLNGCRVVYSVGDESSFGFAYGTLTNHAEMGEELFQVSINRESDEVTYLIRAASKPRALLARIGYPYVRFCQARFRRDSLTAMRRAIGNPLIRG
ncbi:MAG TPA: DUF1990 domain-containing protein [Pyrinomonadaceae bacterium]|nr:DUF1990 domain-containing protein [Pyrinomonadaceae bacterium]